MASIWLQPRLALVYAFANLASGGVADRPAHGSSASLQPGSEPSTFESVALGKAGVRKRKHSVEADTTELLFHDVKHHMQKMPPEMRALLKTKGISLVQLSNFSCEVSADASSKLTQRAMDQRVRGCQMKTLLGLEDPLEELIGGIDELLKQHDARMKSNFTTLEARTREYHHVCRELLQRLRALKEYYDADPNAHTEVIDHLMDVSQELEKVGDLPYVEIVCRCEHGKAAVGFACKKVEEHSCVSCDDDYEISDGKCQAIQAPAL